MDIKDINYIDYGTNKNGVIVLLHGWNQNIDMMNMLGEPFKDNYRVIVLDLPGFGKSKEPNESWNVVDYTKCLKELLDFLKVKNPILIGHSFGGRISICYSSMYGAKKVVLLSSPFRPKKKRKTFKTYYFKFIKSLHNEKLTNYYRNKFGSTDYKNASLINRGTLVKVVNEDLTEYAKNIKCPVLLIYGTSDTEVNINEAKELVKLIPDSGLVEYPNRGHYAYLDNLNQTINVLHSFLD